MPKNVQFWGMASVRCNSKSPTQLIGGPGSKGRKLPSMPTSMRTNPIISNAISIIKFLSKIHLKGNRNLSRFLIDVYLGFAILTNIVSGAHFVDAGQELHALGHDLFHLCEVGGRFFGFVRCGRHYLCSRFFS